MHRPASGPAPGACGSTRGGDGEWIVIDIWRSEADADACDARWASDPVATAFMALIDPSSVRTARYTTLD